MNQKKLPSRIIRPVFGIVCVLSFSFLSCFISGCKTCVSDFDYEPPVNHADGIAVGTLEAVNIDTSIIAAGVKKIKCGKFNEVHSMLIYKDDALVFEEYYPGHLYVWDAPGYHGGLIQWDGNKLHDIMSCTKSFTSACIGIAIEQGFIDNVHQSIFDYLPDHQAFNKDGKENITIEHLLTMTSGLAWNEWNAAHGSSANDIDRIYIECSNDPVKCVLERKLKKEPGEAFNYNGGGMLILGEILKNASKMDMDAFSMKYLFGPMGVDSSHWYRFENGSLATDGSLKLTPRDMLKLGITYLHNGIWNDTRLLPAEWVTRSSETYNRNEGINIPIEDTGRNGYGYSWWISEFSHKGEKIKMYRAGGWGGQAIMVFPEVDMVIVFTGGNYATRSKLFSLIRKYVLPAIS